MRGKKEGSVYFDKIKNRWIARISYDGRRPYRIAKTQQEALEKLKALNAEADQNLPIDRYPLFRDYIMDWLEAKEISGVSINTYVSYEYLIRRYLIPQFGRYHLDELTPQRITRTYSRLVKSGISRNICSSMHKPMSASLKIAVANGVLMRNPCEFATVPKHREYKEMVILEEDEYTNMLNYAKEHKPEFYPVLYIALQTGMRRSELCGLQWRDINFEESEINVVRQVDDRRGKFIYTDLKTERSAREIALTPEAILFLRNIKEQQKYDAVYFGYDFSERSPVFRKQTTGSPIKPHYLTILVRTICNKLPEHQQTFNIKHATFHCTRHTHASMLLRMGVLPKVVQERLGHTSIAITMDIYSHLMPNMQKDAIVRFTLNYDAFDGEPVPQRIADEN